MAGYVARMNSGDLTKQQAGALFSRISPMLGYLVKLRKRMVEKRFDGDDELYQAVRDAEMAVYELRQQLHRIECGNVMHERRPPDNPR